MMNHDTFKAGFVGVLGMPNAGKSTLVNQLIGEKVGIVSSRPQTTRNRCLGILNNESEQIVFIDAPGFIKAEKGLNKFLFDEYESVLNDSDSIMLVLNIDCKKMEPLLELAEQVHKKNKPWFIVISKVDHNEIHRVDLLKSRLSHFNVPIVVYTAKGNEEKRQLKQREILGLCRRTLPDSPEPLYPVDSYTSQTLRELSSEIIREKIFFFLNQEIPYGAAVKVLKYDENQKIDKIYADILVQKENYKKIVVGKGGQTLKKIGQAAREEISRRFDKKIYLELHVKHSPWQQKKSLMKELGFVHETH